MGVLNELSLPDLVVSALLFLLLIITIAYATPLKNTNLFFNEILVRFIPKWNFFAPRPGTHDFYLLYREQQKDLSVGPWINSTLADYSRSGFNFIWNSQKTGKKALFDLASTLTMEKHQTEEDTCRLKLSIPYLLLLTYVTGSCSPLCEKFQFIIYKKDTSQGTNEIVFNSDWHKT